MNGTKETPIEFEKFHNIVDGLPRSSTNFHRGTNPSDGKELWEVPIASENDLDDAVEAARKAFKTWSKTKWEDRQEIIKNIAKEFMKYEAEMGKLVMLEGGKPKFLPPGVLQALNGDDKLGPLMTEHPGINMITFTGSTPTGKRVMASCAKTLKRVTLELGGNSAAIICPDVDVNKVAPKVALAAFFNSGQICVASKRLYVHKDIYADMLAAVKKVVEGWKTAPAVEEGTMLGPVQNKMQHAIVKDFFEDCASQGYDFALQGEVGKGEGFVVQPAIIDNPPDDSRIVREEQFGPIVPMLQWEDEDEVIARVNDTTTGLGGAVYCADLDRAQRLASRIEAGNIWINSNEKPLPNAFFSGWKESGIGGESGRLGLYNYMNTQVTHLYKADVAKL
ncbi:putative Betaine aldehyde dehydrogenase, chloroplastic [Glarea lozoyensis 74030]|uniref:aldehyde dehydrogenase (NAD(+)) n=1 Tax=Glarea lozoyensis (strain ATCC 74030 / MF5533) TaxID=1104152 RepID=H0EVA9_GLAL7|nr:putative Betaine aldehyde dehydrogenase, chloroplastic [Glarea lozoyensis 74030]